MRKIAIATQTTDVAMMRVILGCVLVLLAIRTLTAWEATLSPSGPGPYPELKPFVGEFRFGWSEIEAARVKAEVSYRADRVILKAIGGTLGFARALYALDISFDGEADRVTLQTVSSQLVERYAALTVTERVLGENGMLMNLRSTDPPGEKPPRWKTVKVIKIRDIWAAMLYIRSQSLAAGEMVRLLVFPGGSPYLVEIIAIGPDRIDVMGAPRDAIKLDLKIQHVNTKKGNTLEPHGKFRSGKIWLSSDPSRMPLRAEIDIFIGYVFAEVVAINVNEGIAL